MAKCTVEDVMESIDEWTVLSVNKLVKGLEEKYGISAAPAVAVGAVAGGAAAPVVGAGPVEEKTDFNVVLVSAGDKKIQVIKAVRELTGLGLKEAKDLVEGAPKPVKTGLPRAQAEEIKKKIEESGGTVEIK